MRVPSWFKFVGYPAWFLAVFFVSLYLGFPLGSVREPLTDALETALGKGKQGRFGTDPEVRIGSVEVGGGLGLHFERLEIQLASRTKDPGATLSFDELTVSVGALSVLLGEPTLDVDARAYGGTLTAAVSLAPKEGDDRPEVESPVPFLDGALVKDPAGHLRTIVVDVEGLRLQDALFLQEKVGLPLVGTLELDVDLDLGNNPSKEGSGSIELALRGLQIGPGEKKIPMMGAFSVPLIDGGNLDGTLTFTEGKGRTEGFNLTGRDLRATIEPEIALAGRLSRSRLSGGGNLKLTETFLNNNAKFKALLELPGPQKQAMDSEDRLWFSLRGTLGSPGGAMDRTKGKGKPKRGRRR